MDQLVLHIADMRDQIRDYALDDGTLVHRHRCYEIHPALQKEVRASDGDESTIHDYGRIPSVLQTLHVIDQTLECGHIRGRTRE